MKRALSLQQRRQLLVVECALQRSTLLAQTRQLGFGSGLMQSGHSLLERLKNMPLWISIGLAALVIFVPGRAARLARNGLMLWQFWRNLRPTQTDQAE